MQTAQKLLLATGFIAGAFALHIFMMYPLAWDENFERCCLTVLSESQMSQLAVLIENYSWLPVIGAVIGLLLAQSLWWIGKTTQGFLAKKRA